MRRSRTILAAACVVVVGLALAAVLAGRFGIDARAVRSPLVGRPAPAETFSKLDGGGDISLADYKGSVVVVNFFASWCVPCQAEHAELAQAAEALAPRGVRFIGVVYQDSPDNVHRFLAQYGETYDVVTDAGFRAAIDFGMFGVPETFFVDRNGVVDGKVAGPVTAALVTSNVERMLARPPS